jgi:hypothetical protein
MKEPSLETLLRNIRRVRAKRSRDLIENLEKAIAESNRRQYTWGMDVVIYSSGVERVLFKAPPQQGPEFDLRELPLFRKGAVRFLREVCRSRRETIQRK